MLFRRSRFLKGHFRQALNNLVQQIRTTVEVTRVVNPSPTVPLPAGSIATLRSSGARHVEVVTAAGVSGVLEQTIPPNGQGLMRFSGPVLVRFVSGLTAPAPAPHQFCYASNASAGRATNVRPTGPGDVVCCVGEIVDATGYAADGTCLVLLKSCACLPIPS